MKKQFLITVVSFIALMGLLFAWFSKEEPIPKKDKDDKDNNSTLTGSDNITLSATSGEGLKRINERSRILTMDKLYINSLISEYDLFKTPKIGLKAMGFYKKYLNKWGGSFPFIFDNSQAVALKAGLQGNGMEQVNDQDGNMMVAPKSYYTFYNSSTPDYLTERALISRRLLNDIAILKNAIRKQALADLKKRNFKFKD